MNLILQIETTTPVCSVALARGGNVLGCREIEQKNIHAEKITVFIDELLAETKLSYAALDAVAVSSGPGSYTGLRIGVSVAKGLCFALDKPLIAVDTLAAMADGFIRDRHIAAGTLLCPMIDARRMEVFTAVFDGKGGSVSATSAEIIDANSFSDLLRDHQLIFFGDGAGKCAKALGTHANATIISDFTNSATHLVKRAKKKFDAKEFEDLAYFEPYYLKDFIAGRKAV